MKLGMTILTLYLFLTGCAFKSDDSKDTQIYRNQIRRKTPAKVRIENEKGKWALIDTIEMPRGDYNLDNTVVAKGAVNFPHLYPQFKDTQCQGLGYEVSYESRQKTATPKLLVVPFVNGEERKNDHLVLSAKDELKLAIYSDYEPISEYVETELLPNEYVKSLQPSNVCHYMCSQVRVKPMRQLKDMGPGFGCFFPLLGNGADIPTRMTSDMWFFPEQLEMASTRDRYIKWISDCDAVRSNTDLQSYYQQATDGTCTYGGMKTMMREWYFVEIKIPYQAPVYSIENFSQIVRATTNSQTSGLIDQSVTPIRVWSN